MRREERLRWSLVFERTRRSIDETKWLWSAVNGGDKLAKGRDGREKEKKSGVGNWKPSRTKIRAGYALIFVSLCIFCIIIILNYYINLKLRITRKII